MKKIIIRGAKEHNLKNIDLDLPRDQLIVFTGVSGSGKSSLAFDTIYAEGQRRYVESLSAYARQFLGQMEKPRVDFIGGLSPAISIEQKSTSKNPRSTVGTVTEIYDYLRLLFSRCGTPYCPNCDIPVGSQTVDQIVDRIMELPESTRFMILAPKVRQRKGEYKDLFDEARKEGFVRVRVDGHIMELEQKISLDKKLAHTVEIVVDRLVMKGGVESRLADSVELALQQGDGLLILSIPEKDDLMFSSRNACLQCGKSFDDLSPQHFSFNHPLGMCPECDGLGRKLELDPDLIVPDKDRSVVDGAMAPWKNVFQDGNDSNWSYHVRSRIESFARKHKISLTKPWKTLSRKAQDLLLHGDNGSRGEYHGIIPEMERWFQNTTSEGFRSYLLETFMHRVPCETCHGGRLKAESLAVRFGGRKIKDVTDLSVTESFRFFKEVELESRQMEIAGTVLKEIFDRLKFLDDVGLGYLTLSRSAPTLSGGEAQRIRLASQIGSALVGVLYVLDEPSIGLHQRDNRKLIDTLLHLRDLGNTVLVVEHDMEMMESADYLVDFGPGAGRDGGEIIVAGKPEVVRNHPQSMTGAYLSGREEIPIPEFRRAGNGHYLQVIGAAENNLKNIDVQIPLGQFICVTGVSGSGKSSLITEILFKALDKQLHRAQVIPGQHREIRGVEHIDKVIEIDQKPIGRTPRSNPATYVKVFDPIRQIFCQLPEAKMRGYKAGRFSFNVKGGRCEACSGDGAKCIEMHFLPDVYVTCEVCQGKRFNRETLQVKYKGHTIADVLDLSVKEALELFKNVPRIGRILQTLSRVGLDYVHLGQPAPTLSGGEAQRVKLAKELSRRDTGNTLYILDEPTTGLHFEDIKKLLHVLNELVDRGNTVVVIEHNLDVIKSADSIIDLGPEGGDGGGMIVATGAPEEIAANPNSYTGQFLKSVLHQEATHKRTA
ncbi:MAG: excinuclease ABC subunit UvrA [Candidatus Omnitrophota bacterium]|jgi:excinuclease ABC subunit A|nr:MAG: excinuclease ABC subunit UvrA [Candidatus Omnitrophota bacterium]